jgi:hypothetical protein
MKAWGDVSPREVRIPQRADISVDETLRPLDRQ